jgi:hypothetical protein
MYLWDYNCDNCLRCNPKMLWKLFIYIPKGEAAGIYYYFILNFLLLSSCYCIIWKLGESIISKLGELGLHFAGTLNLWMTFTFVLLSSTFFLVLPLLLLSNCIYGSLLWITSHNRYHVDVQKSNTMCIVW